MLSIILWGLFFNLIIMTIILCQYYLHLFTNGLPLCTNTIIYLSNLYYGKFSIFHVLFSFGDLTAMLL